MGKGNKGEYATKNDFFNKNMNDGKSHSQTKSAWKNSEEKAFFDRGDHLSGKYVEPDKDVSDPAQDFAHTSEDL